MKLFRVTLSGHGLQLRMENAAPTDVGFVKNEYVLAESANEARKRAIEHVRSELQQQSDAGGLVLTRVGLEIDEVVHSMKFWKLIHQEGFVFFPRERAQKCLTASLPHCE